MKKYDQEYLDRNNLTEEWFDEQYQNISISILKCQTSVMKFICMDYTVLHACLPACNGYSFHVSKPDDLGCIEVTVYIK